MQSILEELYFGNIDPIHAQPYETERSIPHRKQADKLQKNLEELLDEHGQQVLHKLQEAVNAETSIFEATAFAYGFKLAALLMVEVFTWDAQGSGLE